MHFRAAFLLPAVILAVMLNHARADEETQKVFLNNSKGDQPLHKRLITATGDTVRVKLGPGVACSPYNQVRFEEKERHSRIYDDLKAVLSVVRRTAVATLDCDPDKVYEHPLKYERSTLTVTAAGPDKSETMTVLTGPVEHWYIGVDLPVSKLKTLKHDSNSRTLQPKDAHPRTYLSINYSLGDVAGGLETEPRFSTKRISIKGFVLASEKPFDSYGVGIGYDVRKITALDLNGFSVFAGRFWTKEDRISSTGTQESGGTGRQWRVGITYDVGAGLKWFKAS